MLGSYPSWYWKIMWMGLAPVLVVCIVIASLYSLIAKDIGYEAWSSVEVCPLNDLYSPFVSSIIL